MSNTVELRWVNRFIPLHESSDLGRDTPVLQVRYWIRGAADLQPPMIKGYYNVHAAPRCWGEWQDVPVEEEE